MKFNKIIFNPFSFIFILTTIFIIICFMCSCDFNKSKEVTNNIIIDELDEESNVIRIIDTIRNNHNLSKLSRTSDLDKLAEEITSNKNDILLKNNIAINLGNEISSENLIAYWFNGQSYLRNILNEDFNECGISCYYDNMEDIVYWCMIFR